MTFHYSIRRAQQTHVPAIVALFAEDILGKTRETAIAAPGDFYYQAFAAIEKDQNQELLVVEDEQQQIIATLQLTFIPNMTLQGGWRAQIEGVHVRSDYRGKGIGKWLIQAAISKAKERNCRLVQLTSNKVRTDAIRFYESLGFIPSHVGFKLPL